MKGNFMYHSELLKRIIVGAVGVPVILGITLFGKLPFLIMVDIILVLALWELYTLAKRKGFSPSNFVGILSVLAVSWDFYFFNGQCMGRLLLFIIFFVLIVELFKGKNNALANSAITLFGIFYISLFSFFILIRELSFRSTLPYTSGGWIVILIFVTIWLCDTGAYLFGSLFGTHPLFPRVSPKKTWEGAIGGFIVGIASAIGLRYLIAVSLSLIDAVIIGAIVGIVGQLSDLIESLYKRDAGVKDSSNILPGHGGFLDRFDSPLLVGPTVYLFFVISGFIK